MTGRPSRGRAFLRHTGLPTTHAARPPGGMTGPPPRGRAFLRHTGLPTTHAARSPARMTGRPSRGRAFLRHTGPPTTHAARSPARMTGRPSRGRAFLRPPPIGSVLKDPATNDPAADPDRGRRLARKTRLVVRFGQGCRAGRVRPRGPGGDVR